MILVFFDESKNDSAYPHYHLGAVCVDESVLADIEERINSLAEKAFGTTTLRSETEFHAAEIFHRKSNFKEWTEFDRRVALLGDFVDILSLDEVGLIDIQINCAELHADQSAEEIAFMFLCEKANGFVGSKKSLGMLIGDRESDQHSARYATTLSNYRAKGTDFAYGRDIKYLVDSVHFTQSHLSRFLQLADIYVWLLQFRHRNRESKNFRHQAILTLSKREGANLFPSRYKHWPKHST